MGAIWGTLLISDNIIDTAMQSVIYYVRAVCINKKHMQHKVHLRFVGHTRLDIKEKDLARREKLLWKMQRV